ncbi:MAG: hypothetical protein R2876_04315 [Eubacteriales bacterium]
MKKISLILAIILLVTTILCGCSKYKYDFQLTQEEIIAKYPDLEEKGDIYLWLQETWDGLYYYQYGLRNDVLYTSGDRTEFNERLKNERARLSEELQKIKTLAGKKGNKEYSEDDETIKKIIWFMNTNTSPFIYDGARVIPSVSFFEEYGIVFENATKVGAFCDL